MNDPTPDFILGWIAARQAAALKATRKEKR